MISTQVWVKVTAPRDRPAADLAELAFVLLSTRLPALAKFTGPGAGRTAHYMVGWRSTRGEEDPWSETASVTVGAYSFLKPRNKEIVMAKRDRRVFRSVTFVEEVIENASGVIGTIRIKPSTLMWKPKNARGGTPYYGVPLEHFEAWITTTPHATKMAQ